MTLERAETVIIGGGIAGISLAYFLARSGDSGIVVIEANELASGCTRWSLGGVRQQFSSPAEVELAIRGRNFWQSFEQEFDYPCHYFQDGYLLITGRAEVLESLNKAAQVQQSVGATQVHMLSTEELLEVVPWLNPEGLLGGCYTPLDGRFNPTDGLYGIAKAATKLGVVIHEHSPVVGINEHEDGWHIDGTHSYLARRVVIATGLNAPQMVRPFGVELDIQPLWLHCGYTTAMLEGQTIPLTIDLDTGMIIEREADGVCVTVSDTTFGPHGAHAVMEKFGEIAQHRAPIFADAQIKSTSSAAFDATGGDGHAYIGEIEAGLWVFAGFDGHGTMQGPALAELMCNMMHGISDPVIDVSMFDPKRKVSDKQEWMRAQRREV